MIFEEENLSICIALIHMYEQFITIKMIMALL